MHIIIHVLLINYMRFYFMDSDSYLQIRNYISKILRESILKEGATGSALAAKVARVLIDICIDNYADIGLLYLKYYTGTTNEKAYHAFHVKGREIKLLGDDRQGAGLIRMKSWSQSFPVTAGVYLPDDLRYHGRAARAYIEYRGDVCIVASGMMEKYKINHNDIHSAVRELADNEEIQKLKRAGEDFLSYVQSEEDRKQLIKSFGSVSAIGYFAAIFAVVIPAGGSSGALGHVSSRTAGTSMDKPVLIFHENRMTVSDPDFNHEIRRQLPDGGRLGRHLPLPLNTTMEKPVQPGSALRKLAATNTTYIHELQHLIQHAVYQTPTRHAQNIEMASDDPDRYHPYNVYQPGASKPVLQGMIKSRRPSSQQIEIMSELLTAANLIDPQEKKVSGVNSPLFDYIGSTSGGSSGDGGRLYMTLDSRYGSDQNLEESWSLQIRGIGFIDSIQKQLNFILSSIPSKKKPAERESQLARFGSSKGKKAVGRKYRLFLADAFENAGLAKRILKFDTSDSDSRIGPEEIKKRLPPDEDGEVTPLEMKMEKFLANKGGRLTKSDFNEAYLGMPSIGIYFATLDISFGLERNVYSSMINIPLPWLKNYIDKALYSDIVEVAKSSKQKMGILESGLIDRIAAALDIKVAITQPISLIPKSSIPKIAAIAGFTSRVQSGVAEIGAAWYERAANYIWPQMRTEYDAEFTASNGLVLYNLYLLGSGEKEEMPRSMLEKINRNSEPLFRALIEEDIEKVEDAFTSIRPGSSHASRFMRYIPREERAEKSDQDRRLAIDLIEIAQDISDEELDEIIQAAAMQADSSAQWPEDSKKFKDILQEYIDDTDADPSVQYEFLQLFRLEFLGLIGKKFLS